MKYFIINKCILTQKITVFGIIFDVNSSLGQSWDLSRHFDKKEATDFSNNNSLMLYVHMAIV